MEMTAAPDFAQITRDLLARGFSYRTLGDAVGASRNAANHWMHGATPHGEQRARLLALWRSGGTEPLIGDPVDDDVVLAVITHERRTLRAVRAERDELLFLAVGLDAALRNHVPLPVNARLEALTKARLREADEGVDFRLREGRAA